LQQISCLEANGAHLTDVYFEDDPGRSRPRRGQAPMTRSGVLGDYATECNRDSDLRLSIERKGR
jgi:hypothetical protein